MLFLLLFAGTVTEGKNLFISRASGNDSWSCDLSNPCKTISRAVELASSGDHILLDGNNTDKNPYNCQSMSPELSGVQINKTLFIMGYGSPMPHIQCKKGEGLQFKGSDNEQQMNVTLSRLIVSQSSIMVQDSSVHIDDCRFEGSNQGVAINIRTRLYLSILVKNSIFTNNRACVSVVVNSTSRQSQNIKVVFKMTNSSFLFGNVVKNVSRCISFTELQNSGQSVSCDITLEDTTFFGNKFFLPQGLIFLEINNGRQYIQFKSVTFFDNAISSAREDLMIDSVLCIVRCTDVNISISSSTFSSEYAKVLSGSAEDISLQIFNSTFRGHNSVSNGGVISLTGTNHCQLKLSKSSFVNTHAHRGHGGAINIDCFFIDKISLQETNFTRNHATFGEGGALRVNASMAASVELSHSAFIKCFSSGAGAAVVIHSDRGFVILSVESSRFEKCTNTALGSGGCLSVFSLLQSISIYNSDFISNLNGAVSINSPSYRLKKRRKSVETGLVKIHNSTFFYNKGILSPLFISVQGGTVIFQNVAMESNTVTSDHGIVDQGNVDEGPGDGGAAFIGYNCFLIIQQSRFVNNNGAYMGGALLVQVSIFEVNDSLFIGNKVGLNEWQGRGGALYVFNGAATKIYNTTFSSCVAEVEGGAIYVESGEYIVIKKSRFVENNAGDHSKFAETGLGGATYVLNTPVIFEETTFHKNTGVAGGAIYLDGSDATFRNCYAVDNFAAGQGGFLYAALRLQIVLITDSVFNQTVKELKWPQISYNKSSFIVGDSLGALRIFNSTMGITPYDGTGPFLLVTNITWMDLGKNNLTSLNCPIGSKMKVFNFTVSDSRTQKTISTLQFSCSACSGNSYSLQRGRAVGGHVVPGFQCLPCPFGANCSLTIVAKKNFWGFEERTTPPTLKFTMCPLDYCRSPDIKDFPEYNGCQGNRSGELCGQCGYAYSETLYSTHCRPSYECNDYWDFPVGLLYVLVMALYFTFKPPILPWSRRQILWFKNYQAANEEEIFDRGYLKIVFYLYQAADLVLVSSSSQRILKTKFVEPFIGLFNFRQKFSSKGLVCPFPGLTVVTKRLFAISHVFGTCLMIGIFYVVHYGVQKFQGQGAPSVGPYVGGVLQTMLLGYATLASASFNLLRCVPIGPEKRLFYDGNVECFQWWQYILIVFICVLFVPFVVFLLWGPVKLFRGTISVGKFLLACCFPLPCLLYWVFAPFIAKNSDNLNGANGQESKMFVERVIYDPFKRPEDGGKLSLSWESVMIGRRLILIIVRAFVTDPMPRLVIMILLCVLFLLHHALTLPFRDGTANILETISLLSLVFLATVNAFFASFLSLAVSFNDHFKFWWNFCEVVELVIVGAVPLVVCLILAAAVFSQLCRLILVVSAYLRNLWWVCFMWCSNRKETDDTRPLES